MPNFQNITQEIQRIEVSFLNVKQEIKTLKNSIRAYKGWTTKYRKQQQELKQANLAITEERDQAVQELKINQKYLLEAIEEAKKAKKSRDNSLLMLDNLINQIE